MLPWSPDSWRSCSLGQHVRYDDPAALSAALARLRGLPPLVSPWEVDALKRLLADAQRGRRFVLQGGDCAETIKECGAERIINKIKILLQMSLVLIQGAKKPVVRIGRFAGQYAKPRSSPTEARIGPDGARVELPSYFGDLINHAEFTEAARRPDPQLMIDGYLHAALTLNLIRSLAEGGFADLHHPEYWDLSFFERADLPAELREDYLRTTHTLSEALRFMEAIGEASIETLTRVSFFTSHEGLNLYYEAAQTREVAPRPGFYDLTAHLPWIGERTRTLDGAHVEFFRGIRNPVGVKLGPSAQPDEVVRLVERLNPDNEEGKIVLIPRLGAERVEEVLPELIAAVRRAGQMVLWVSDPMHGNTHTTESGTKTRSFDRILLEIERSFSVHEALGTHMGGVHFELTGEDVTECVGGAAGITYGDLCKNYASLCDPRLNYRQSLEMAFRIARRMRAPSNALP